MVVIYVVMYTINRTWYQSPPRGSTISPKSSPSSAGRTAGALASFKHRSPSPSSSQPPTFSTPSIYSAPTRKFKLALSARSIRVSRVSEMSTRKTCARNPLRISTLQLSGISRRTSPTSNQDANRAKRSLVRSMHSEGSWICRNSSSKYPNSSLWCDRSANSVEVFVELVLRGPPNRQYRTAES